MNPDTVYLNYILECISNIEDLTSDGRSELVSTRHQKAAVLYYLQTMAESTQRLSESLKNTEPEVDWLGVSGFRNRLVHGCLEVNMDVVWNIIEKDLPALKQAVINMLQSLKTDETE